MGISPSLRKKFPVLRQGIYANTAADGPMHEDLFSWRQEHELDLLIGASEHFGSGLRAIKSSRLKLADFCSCRPQQIAFIPSFSLGLNLLLQLFPTNQNVLLIEEDYPSVNWPFEKLGFKIHQAKVGRFLEEDLYEKIRTNNIDILAVSIVQWLSGALLDLNFIKNLKAEFPNLMIIADGTQFCGMFPFDFSESGIDVMIASGYKWMLSGYGNAFMLFNEQFMSAHNPTTIGFGSVRGDKGMKDSIPFCNYFEPGHLDSLAFGSFGISIDFLQEIGMKNIKVHNAELSSSFIKLSVETGLLPDWVYQRNRHSTIFNIKANEEVFQKLMRNNIVCALRGDGIRLSFHFFNTLSELETIFKVLEK